MEEFENKEQHAVEIANYKDRLKFIIDSADSITKDKNLSPADKINAERIRLDVLAMLQDATVASTTSPDSYSALKKIVELHSVRACRSRTYAGKEDKAARK